jgi:hypothetical protein
MHESATLHFDLSHLAPGQPFTLHAGLRSYDLVPHTRQSLALSRRTNVALDLVPDERITHFAGPVRLPGNSPLLLRVTAPKRDPDDLLDRLVLVSLHIPRRHRMAALAQQRLQGRPVPLPPKLAFLGAAGNIGGLTADDLLIDIANMATAMDAAEALIFHHPEVMTIQADKAAQIAHYLPYANGLFSLAQSILRESKAHEKDASKPNWVNFKPGTHFQTGQPANPVYVWSGATLEYLQLPLRDVLQKTKNDPALEHQCWTVQAGTTQVPMTEAPASGLVADAQATYTVMEKTPQSGVEHDFSYDPASSTATVSLKNYYLRWLQVNVDQYAPGPDGKQVGQTQVLGQQSPVDTIMAVPLDPDWSPYQFKWDDQASRAVVSIGGIGQPPADGARDMGGIAWTAIFNFAVPMLFLTIGVAEDQEGKAWSDVTKQVVGKLTAVVEALAEGPLAGVVNQSVEVQDVLLMLANLESSLLLAVLDDAGASALQAYITVALGEGAAEKAEPFIGWIALAIGAAADIASMIETSVEVARSPATMAISIERAVDVTVTVTPDQGHAEGTLWPSTATHYTISITYDNGPAYTYPDLLTDEDKNPSPPDSRPKISHTFTGLPAAGTITVQVQVYAANGWLAGQGMTRPMPAQPTADGKLVVPAFAITENLVPLSAGTTYRFKEKLAFGQGARVWCAPPACQAPTATVSDLDGASTGSNLWQLGPLTLNEAKSALGYSWSASGQHVPKVNTTDPWDGQEFTFQSVSEGQNPQSGLMFSGAGWTDKPCLAFPPPTMANPLADGFVLEPDPAGQSMMLRAISLTQGSPFIASPGQSFGRFTYGLQDLAIHPAGYAVALDAAHCKLEVARLTALAADAHAPAAAIYSGKGTRPGLLSSPVAVACSDKIMVLQTDPKNYPQGCVCAFDVKGNPVYCFAGKTSVAGLHPEGIANVVVVDLSVESQGYLYVLKHLAPASGPVLASDYRLDIYNPDGTFLAQVTGLAAASLHVDLWRNVFTLNYEILPGSGRTEPSVSQWTPSTPGASNASTGGS